MSAHDTHENDATIHGLLAEFETPEALLSATKQAFADGYRKMDAYSPFPIHGLAAALVWPSHIRGDLAAIVAGEIR